MVEEEEIMENKQLKSQYYRLESVKKIINKIIYASTTPSIVDKKLRQSRDNLMEAQQIIVDIIRKGEKK